MSNIPTHGHARRGKMSSEYRSWMLMKNRCLNKNSHNYHNYGAKGITVCERWLGKDGFKNFLADMGPKPSKSHSLDRFPNNKGNYFVQNCRWATSEMQQNNKTNNVIITFRGETKPLAEWSGLFNITKHLLYERLFVLGWEKERAFTEKSNRPPKISNP